MGWGGERIKRLFETTRLDYIIVRNVLCMRNTWTNLVTVIDSKYMLDKYGLKLRFA